MKSRLIVVGPVPPPYHGVTVSTSLVLASRVLRERFEVLHVDTSDHRSGRNVGTWDFRNVLTGVTSVLRLLRHLRGPGGIVYLPLSQSAPGFLRDAVLIYAAVARRWRVVVHLRGSDFPAFYSNSPKLLQRVIRCTLDRLHSVAVMGESLRGVLDGLVPPERVAVVPNGTPEPRLNGVRRDPRCVLFLSNLRRRKGVVEALEAAKIVLRAEPKARFVFAGEWESEDLASALEEEAADDTRIRFIPGVADSERDCLLASAGILLFPPVEPEGHPRVVLEGLAAGLPIVTTDRGAIRETVIDAENGFVLSDPEPELLAERLLLLLRDVPLRNRMAHAARARYLDCFTQDCADRRLAAWLGEVDE